MYPVCLGDFVAAKARATEMNLSEGWYCLPDDSGGETSVLNTETGGNLISGFESQRGGFRTR
jgi:hypothetical protein